MNDPIYLKPGDVVAEGAAFDAVFEGRAISYRLGPPFVVPDNGTFVIALSPATRKATLERVDGVEIADGGSEA